MPKIEKDEKGLLEDIKTLLILQLAKTGAIILTLSPLFITTGSLVNPQLYESILISFTD